MAIRIYKGLHRTLFQDLIGAHVGTGEAQLFDAAGNSLTSELVTISLITADTSITATTRIEGAA